MDKQTFKGEIIEIMPTRTGIQKDSGRRWVLGEYALVYTDGRGYQHNVCFELWDKVQEDAGITIGDIVEVDARVESYKHSGRWFTKVKGYAVRRLEGGAKRAQEAVADSERGAEDDLPF